ncbi:OmpA family protein [Sulfurimonas sp.]|uniref:OmpA family protein n=1 Tax=Sulfurimonas sp. TaxID=2022749 RepID=UPI002636D06C|nr:OmpA family protein [Sulfurimonas sp.]
MKIKLFLSLILITTLNAVASDFSLIIHKPFDGALFDITQDYDRTISAVGFTKNYNQKTRQQEAYTNAFDYLSSVSHKYGKQMQLVKVDKGANIVLSKTASLAAFNEAVSVIKTPNNGYIIGGYTMDGSLLLMKLDSQANVLFSKQFGTKNFDKMNSLVPLRDGGVLAVGSSFTSRSSYDDAFVSGLGNDDIYLTRFSKNGQKLWSKKYGTEYDDHGINAVEAPDGSLLILAATLYDKHKDVTLMRLSENGNKIWLKHFKSTKLTEPKKIIFLKDNNFLVSLAQYNEAGKAHIRLIKFDLYKNILADKEIKTTYASVLNDIQEFSNGKIIGVGYVKDTFNTDGLAMIFDTHLTLLKQEHYGGKNYDTFNAVKILHNSQIAVAGVHTDKNSQEENMWIVKLNSDATMAQTAVNANDFYTQLCDLFAYKIKNKQLQITKDLRINIIDPRLYFQVGQYKLTPKQEAFIKKFAKKLVAFLHKHQDQVKTLEINGHTSSEWKNANFEKRYLNNADLSAKRSLETLKALFKAQNTQEQKWLTEILKESGLSYKDKVMLNAKEEKKKSRRVTFKIILK